MNSTATEATREPINLNEVTGYTKAQKEKKKPDPNKLDNTAFMKLFLEQLKNQDPTAPMETDKIITQTAQLTQVEMQEQTKQTMIEVAEAMKSTKETNEELKNFQADMKSTLEGLLAVLSKEQVAESPLKTESNALAMIGKIAETNINGLNMTQNQPLDFELYFDEPIDITKGIPKILIFNENQELVKEMDISAYAGKSGYLKFVWDSKNNAMEDLPSGAYNVIANYNFNPDGSYNIARIGRGEVQSVIFDEGKPHLRMGELIVPLSDAVEFYLKQ